MWKQISSKGRLGTSRSRAGGDRGQILVLTAVSMTVLLGIAALSIDASFMYDKRNLLYAAADAAAKSAAIEVLRQGPGVPHASLQAFADQQVAAHGFNPGVTTTVVVNHPPLSGPFTGNVKYVEALVSEPTNTFFGKVLGFTSMTPGARAVAGSSPNANCIVALAPPTYALKTMNLGNPVLTMPGCSLAINGHLEINSAGTIAALSTGVTGLCDGNGGGAGCNNVTNLILGAPPMADPLIGLVAPTNPGGCVPAINQTNLTAGCYTTITMSVGGTVNFGPGIYYVTGPILMNHNVTVTGSGVMIYLAGTFTTRFTPCTSAATAGCFDVGNNAIWTLSAPTSGPYTGILFFQDRANFLNAQFNGNGPIYDLSGMMYFANADVSFRNGMNATNDCMLFVAWSIEIDNGPGAFSNTCTAFGGSPILTVSLGE